MLHISLSGETLFYIGSFPVTSTLLTTWIMLLFFLLFALNVRNRYASQGKKQSRYLIAIEMILGGIYTLFEGVLGKSIKSLFPILATFFLFIIISNWSGLLPGVGTIGLLHENAHAEDAYAEESEEHASNMMAVHAEESGSYVESDSGSEHAIEATGSAHEEIEHNSEESNALFTIGNIVVFWSPPEGATLTPLFRAPTADLNTTIALAIIAVVFLHGFAMKTLGVGTHIGAYINFKSPIAFFVGILEIVSEFGKIISFAFRLFGNIFAGEVLLAVIAFLIPLLAPIPFLGLEVFVGFIQALVFTMLLAVFLNVATQHVEH